MPLPPPTLPFEPSPALLAALRAAAAGAEIVQRHFQSLAGAEIRAKEPRRKSYDLVTAADVQSEAAIAAELRAASPDQPPEILGEEMHAGDVAAPRLWVVDPLDGTNNFAHGVPQFAVSIAFLEQGRPSCGVIVNPAAGHWHVAQRGRGAWRLEAGDWSRCRVSGAAALDRALVGVGFYYDRGEMMKSTLRAVERLFGRHIHGIRRFGSAALDLCMVGSGTLDAFFEYQLSPWDFAAGWLFVEEAGGCVTQCDGGDVRIAQSTLLATNGALHPAMQEIVAAHAPAAGHGGSSDA